MSDQVEGVVRQLTRADLPDCYRLAADRGWSPGEGKWRLLFEIGEPYGVDAPDGDGLAGVAILTRYDPAPAAPKGLATISMVLVAARYARRGLGRRIVESLLARVDSATVMLYATDIGRPLYERLGFHAVEQSTMYLGHVSTVGPATTRIRTATPADTDAIRRLDTRATGADRSALLQALPRHAERLLVAENTDGVVGYAGAWLFDGLLQIGPVVADPAEAPALIDALCHEHTGQVRLDAAHGVPQVAEIARRLGLEAVSDTTIMVEGAPELPGVRSHRLVPALQALG